MQLPYIADLKRGALDDGPGVRTTVFFKGCPLRCVWCHNPECIAPAPELAFRSSACVAGCRDCVDACRERAIGAAGPRSLDRRACLLHADCVAECPSGALELIGRRHEIDELASLLSADGALYRRSGGGVTLSGGEAAMYCEYAGAVAKRLHEHGIHVLLQTAGHFDWQLFERHLAPHLDAVYFDLKLVDPDAHRRWCGRDNRRILENLAHLASGDVPHLELLVRIPLVPAITCTRENLEAAATLLRRLEVRRVALLPYNPLWGSKVTALGGTPHPIPERWLGDEEQQLARDCMGDLVSD